MAGLRKQKKYNWKETNLEFFGSDLEKKVGGISRLGKASLNQPLHRLTRSMDVLHQYIQCCELARGWIRDYPAAGYEASQLAI